MSATRERDPAPDWPSNQPSGNARLGPTWQAMWDALADGEWHDVRELLVAGLVAAGCVEATAQNQPYAVVRARFVDPEARQDLDTHRWRIWYRRTDAGVSP